MNMNVLSRHYKSLLLLIAMMFMLIMPAIAENGTWDCPNCGRKENIGNFCGGCAYPRPSLTSHKTLSVGDFIQFGHYEQNGNSFDGTEQIEWIVLDLQNNNALLVSRYALDCVSFNDRKSQMSWQNSDVRKWLNNSFYNTAFSSSEKAAILKSLINNSPSEGYLKWTGRDYSSSEDWVFLLSYAEAWKYFGSDKERYCGATDYAISRGVEPSTKYQVNGKPTCMWWLRSPGEASNSAAGVRKFGTLDFYQVHHVDVGVRPAIWLDVTEFLIQ